MSVHGPTNRSLWELKRRERNKLLDRESLYTLLRVRVLADQYPQNDTLVWPGSSLGYRPPAAQAIRTEVSAPSCSSARYVGRNNRWGQVISQGRSIW